MTLDGSMIIGGALVRGGGAEFRASEAATGGPIAPPFGGATRADLERACALADAAFDEYRRTAPEARAQFLEAIGEAILGLGDDLIVRAMQETGLPRGRLEGERGRTVGQLKLFANVVREGSWLELRIDPAQPDRKPLPRPDLRLRQIPLGPVAVFGASNFPLAFSVAGGDTASALAAGCPVVVKAHSAHPGVSELVGRAVQRAALQTGMPEGVFSLLFDAGFEIGGALVADARIKAVGFTGSRRGGLALMKIAAERAEPIPVYAEMSSINPVILLPGALARRGEAIAKGFAASLTLGAGQFCTNPGLLLAVDGPDLQGFVTAAATALSEAAAQVMLTSGIRDAYCTGVSRLGRNRAVETVVEGGAGADISARAALFTTTGAAFLGDRELQEEVFGASALVVRCSDLAELRACVAALEGQLTAAVHTTEDDHAAAADLMPILERKVGRILFNGFGTGVEVAHAMVHGGPFPATSDGRSTSVGSLAITRFVRPVCYQDAPAELLPPELRDDNPLNLPRRLDGAPVRAA